MDAIEKAKRLKDQLILVMQEAKYKKELRTQLQTEFLTGRWMSIYEVWSILEEGMKVAIIRNIVEIAEPGDAGSFLLGTIVEYSPESGLFTISIMEPSGRESTYTLKWTGKSFPYMIRLISKDDMAAAEKEINSNEFDDLITE